MSTGKYALEPSLRAVLTDLGLRPAAVLRRAGLRADLLSGGPVWLSQDEFFGLWHAIEAEADDPNLPLRIEDAFSPEVFGAPIFAALMSPDLNTAAQRIAVYKKLIGPMRLLVDVGVERTSISYEWPAGANPPATLLMSELLFWVEMIRTGTRKRVEPVEVLVAEPPTSAEYRRYLGVDVSVGAYQRISFAAEDARRPFLTANEAMWNEFEPSLRKRLSDLEVDADADERVRAVLLELLPVGRSAMADVAAELAMSTRTLQRRLAELGTTFQEVLDRTREDLARHYLTNAQISAAEISFLLGYEETSSFYRAFQNWTGDTPERVRAAAR